MNQAQSFLYALYGDLEEGEFIEMRLVGKEKRRIFFKPDQPEPPNHPKHVIYCG